MTEITDLQAHVASVRAALTGPGGPFEIAEDDVRGERLPAFVRRRRRLDDLLTESARWGDREYLVQGRRRLSFADHLSGVTSLAHALATRFDVGPGDRVVIFAANSPEWVVAFWATASLGAITVAANAWWSRREAHYAVERSRPRLVIADAERAPLLDGLGVPVLRIETDVVSMMAAHPGAALARPPVAEDDPAVIVYTSGTTGHPKGAVHSQRNLLSVVEYHLLNDALAAALGAGSDAPRRFLMSLPLFHIASLHNLALPRLASGDTVVVDAGRFDVERVLALIGRERVTNWAIVPTMAHRLVQHGDLARHDLSSLAAISVNSAPSSVALKDRLRAAIPAAGATLADSYGLTESCTAATVATAADLAQFPTTVGRPVATVSIEIHGSDGRRLPDGAEGEIWLRSPFTMLGYWDDEPATAAAFAAGGWLRTGDIGCLRDGLLYMTTRRSDLILRGGENVYPAEVEAVLDEHPAVRECAVFGVEHADLGQEVAAVIVLADGAQVSEEQLRAFAAERIARYKVPSRWRLSTTALPRTATGKVVRRGVTL